MFGDARLNKSIERARNNAGGRIRTSEGTKPLPSKGSTFNHFATPALEYSCR